MRGVYPPEEKKMKTPIMEQIRIKLRDKKEKEKREFLYKHSKHIPKRKNGMILNYKTQEELK